jgi:hypothetical protein
VNAEWCGICLHETCKVAAVAVFSGVPLCKGCQITYGDDERVLAETRRFLSEVVGEARRPESKRREGAPPDGYRFCACGCGGLIESDGRLRSQPGHRKRYPNKTHRKETAAGSDICKCGKRFRHIGNCVKRAHPESRATIDIPPITEA